MCVSKMAKCMILFKVDKTKVCYQKEKKIMSGYIPIQ